MLLMPLARMASSTLKVAMVFCSRSLRGCSRPKRTSALAARWNTMSQPAIAGSQCGQIEHVAFDQLEMRMPQCLGDEFALAGGKIVVADNGKSGRKQPVDEVAADKARCAGDKRRG